jgi:DNA-binding IclR family transcriptional regulator
MQYTVAAVQEALTLLVLVARQPELGVTELANRSGNTKARAYRLLTTLEESGFIQRNGDAAYSLGYAAVTLGLAAQQQVTLVKVAIPHLAVLGQELNENLGVLVREGIETVSVAKWDCSHELRTMNDVGRRRPLYVGASGKLLLAYAPAEIQKAVLASDLQRVTESTIVAKSKLSKDLSKALAQGYAVSDGEAVRDVIAIAAPLYDALGQVVASVALSLPKSRAPASLEGYIEHLRTTGDKISRDLGWNGTVTTK